MSALRTEAVSGIYTRFARCIRQWLTIDHYFEQNLSTVNRLIETINLTHWIS